MEEICKECTIEDTTIPYKKCEICLKDVKMFKQPCFGKSNFVGYVECAKKNWTCDKSIEGYSNICLECHNRDNNFLCEICDELKPMYNPNTMRLGNDKICWIKKMTMNKKIKKKLCINKIFPIKEINVCADCYNRIYNAMHKKSEKIIYEKSRITPLDLFVLDHT